MPIPLELPFEPEEYHRRLQKVSEGMTEKSLDVLLLFRPHNVFYLSGMDTENLFDYQCLIVPKDAEPILLISSFEKARSENSCCLENVRTFGPFEDPVEATLKVLHEFRVSSGTLGIERRSRAVSADQLEAIQSSLGSFQLVDAFGVVETCRLVKSSAEIAYMRQAAKLTDQGVAAGFAAMSEGVKDFEIAAAITEAMYRNGSDTVCWGPIVAAGYRAGSAHSTFHGHRLEKGETVFLEITGEVRRYTSPLMRTAILGDPPSHISRVEKLVRETLAVIVEQARPGVKASGVARSARAVLEPLLKDFVFHHYFGYPVGVGYPPSWIEELGYFIRVDNDRPLEAGMMFHLPISIRKYGEFAVNLSHTILIGEEATEPLGANPARLHIVK